MQTELYSTRPPLPRERGCKGYGAPSFRNSCLQEPQQSGSRCALGPRVRKVGPTFSSHPTARAWSRQTPRPPHGERAPHTCCARNATSLEKNRPASVRACVGTFTRTVQRCGGRHGRVVQGIGRLGGKACFRWGTCGCGCGFCAGRRRQYAPLYILPSSIPTHRRKPGREISQVIGDTSFRTDSRSDPPPVHFAQPVSRPALS